MIPYGNNENDITDVIGKFLNRGRSPETAMTSSSVSRRQDRDELVAGISASSWQRRHELWRHRACYDVIVLTIAVCMQFIFFSPCFWLTTASNLVSSQFSIVSPEQPIPHIKHQSSGNHSRIRVGFFPRPRISYLRYFFHINDDYVSCFRQNAWRSIEWSIKFRLTTFGRRKLRWKSAKNFYSSFR